jgi:hypothetical protein
MEIHHFSWENPLLMAMFNSYIKLPEGKYCRTLNGNIIENRRRFSSLPGVIKTLDIRTFFTSNTAMEHAPFVVNFPVKTPHL